MANLILFNFILQNFQQALLNHSVIFHCWENQIIKKFNAKATDQSIYLQNVRLNTLSPDNLNNLKLNYLKLNIPVLGVFLDTNCPNADMLLNASSFQRCYSDHYHWILYDDMANIGRFRRLFEKANVSVDSDVTYVIPDEKHNEAGNSSSPTYFIQYDVYNNGPHIGGKLNVTIDRRIHCDESNCTLDQYLSNLYKRSKYGNRNRQSDIKIQLSTVISYLPLTAPEQDRLDFLIAENDRHIDSLARFGFHQIAIIKEMLSTSYDYHWHDQWSLNDTYGGTIQEIISDTADLASSPFSISVERRQLMMPLAETAIFNTICIFRTPLKTGLLNSGEVYLEPFDRIVWIIFTILILLGAIQLWIIFSIEYYRFKRNEIETPSFASSFMISFGTVCAQGSDLLPKTIGGRISYSALILASFIMYNYYTSIIVSTLLGSPVKSDIQTLDQLADSSLEMGFEPIAYNLVYLNVSQVPAVRRIVERKIKKRKNPYAAYFQVDEGVLRVRDQRGQFAYVFNAAAGFAVLEKYYEPDEICDINEISFRPEHNLVNYVHRNSSYIELFRLRFLRLLETGINRRILKQWMRDRLFCFPSTKVVTVALANTAPLFFLLLSAFVISALVLWMEINYHKFAKRGKGKNIVECSKFIGILCAKKV